MATEIRVPVRLEVLHDSISNLLKILSNLLPNTTNFKAVEKIINGMVSEALRLLALLSRPFTNENLFRSTNKTIDKLEESAARILVIMDGLKFSDLKLTPAQLNSFDELNLKIIEIKNNYLALVESAKTSVISSKSNQELIAGLPEGKKILLANFDDIKAAVDKHVSDLESAAQREELAYNKMRSNADRAARARILTSGGPEGGINRESLGESLFNKYLYNKDGENKLRPGFSKAEFLKALEESFLLLPGELQHLADLTLKLINEVFLNMGKNGKNIFEGLLSAYGGKGFAGKITLKEESLNDLKALLTLYQLLLLQIDAAKLALNPQDIAALQEIAGLELQLSSLEGQILKTFLAGGQATLPINLMNTGLSQLRTALELTNALFILMQRTTLTFNQMRMAVVNFMGFNLVLNLTKTAIRNAINHIKELDSVMNKISIVTDMSTGDLWNQVDAYSKMAQAYGVSIKGAYEVSQIYYQLGLQTNDVLTLTNETLKLAKVSGLDYALTTDYMTTALRGFKMEMSEASTVVDVYSNLAAHTAVSLEELAVAMSKTASSMESVGSTFEEASAMIGTMVAVTRESATNIGSALKSIASRYGEMKSDPSILLDAEGEAIAYNKVDAALQSVGISLKTTDGLFRSFTDVILELSEVWGLLESTLQRYIATLFAGNRQQSRFLALVSNPQLLKANLGYAEESEDTGTLLALKALDSIEAKTELVRVAYQQFYTTIGAESVWKGFLDGAKNVINTLNSFPKLFGKIPIGAIAAIASIINVIKTLGTKVITNIAEIFGLGLHSGFSSVSGTATAEAEGLFGLMINTIKGKLGVAKDTGRLIGEAAIQGTKEGATAASKESTNLTPEAQNKFNANQSAINTLSPITDDIQARAAAVSLLNEGKISLAQYGLISREGAAAIKEVTGALLEENTALIENGKLADTSGAKTEGFFKKHASLIGTSLLSFGSALHMAAMMIDTTKEGGKTLSGTFMSIGGAVTLAGIAVLAFNHTLNSIPWMAIISGAFALINGISTLIITPEERLEELEKKAEELSNKAKEEKANYRTLDNSIKKLDELKEKRYESAEATEEYLNAVDELAEKFPLMIAGFDEAGNIILDTTDAERILAEARLKSKEATYEAAKAELDHAKEKAEEAREQLSGHGIASIDLLNDKNYEEANQLRTNLGTKLGVDWTSYMGSGYFTTEEQYQVIYNKMLSRANDNSPWAFIKTLPTLDAVLKYFDELKESGKALSSQELLLYNAFIGDSNTTEGLFLQYENTRLKLNKLLENPTTQNLLEIFDTYTELLSLYSQAKLLPEGTFDFESAEASFKEIGTLISTWTSNIEVSKGYEKLVISAWQLSANADTKAWELLEKSATAAAMVTKLILNAQDNEKIDYTEEMGREYQRSMATFIKSLSPERLDLFNTMTADTANYSAEDIITEFGLENNPIALYIIDYYKEGVTSILTRLNAVFAKSLGKTANADGEYKQLVKDDLKNASDFLKKFFEIILDENLTTIDETYLNKILKLYQNLIKKGYTQRAEDYGTTALSLYKEIEQAPIEVQKSLWNSINTNGLETYEGLLLIKADIENANKNLSSDQLISAKSIDLLEQIIIPNINLEIQTATSNLLETWENTSKEFSSALSGGVSLKDANALIEKAKSLDLDFDLNDFLLVGDKLILIGQSFDDYYTKLTESITSSTTAWQGRIDLANKALSAISEYGQSSMPKKVLLDYKAALEAIGFTDWSNREYVTQWGTLTKEGKKHIQELIDNTTKELTEYSRATQIAARQLLTAHETSQGIYKLIIDKTEVNLSEDLEKLKTIAKGGTIGGSELDEAAIKESINSVYDTFISDVLSKGFKNIKISDYEGLINKGLGIDLASYTSYEQFIRDYVDWTGKTTEEVNNLLLQAYEKDNAKYSEDLIKDFTFTDKSSFKATRDNLTKLANAYDKNIEELIRKSKLAFDETTLEYTISVEQLKDYGVDLSKIHNFETTVQESVDSLFSSLVSDVQNAMSGKLDAKGLSDLQELLKSVGIQELLLDFSKTTEGLKLSEDSFFNLYTNLKKVNALAAKQLIPAIKQQYKQYGNLLDAQKAFQLAQEEGSKDKARAIADVVGEYLREEADVYNFGNQEMPLEWKKAENLYTSVYKSLETITNAGKKNFMTASDFYSQMSFLQAYNPDFKLNGKTAAEWLEIAPEFFTSTKEGFGIDFNQAGITEILKWIEAMYDAADAFRELGLVYELTADTLNKGKDKINLNSIVGETGKVDPDKLKTFINNNKEIADVLKLITINDKSLLDSESTLPDEVLYSILKRLSEGGFDAEHLDQLISEMLGNYAEDIEVSYGENGEIKLTYEPKTITTEVIVGGQKLTGENLLEYLRLKAIEGALVQGEGTEGFTVTYNLDGNHIEVKYDTTGKFTYSCKIPDHTLVANSELELLGLIRMFTEEETSDETTISEPAERVVIIDDIEYTIKVNSDGTYTVEGNDNAIQEKLLKYLNLKTEKPLTADGEVSEITLTAVDGANVSLTNETLALAETYNGIVTGNALNVLLTYIGETTEIPISSTKISGVIDSSLISSTGEVTLVDLSYLGLGIVTLDTKGKKIKGIVDSADTEGSGTVDSDKCILTINGTEVIIVDTAGNTYTGKLPDSVEENTTFSNTGTMLASKAHLKISGGEVTITTADGQLYTATIPESLINVLNPTGSVSVDNCKVYASSNLLYVLAPTGQTFVLGFKEGALANPTGTVKAENCEINVDKDTLTINAGEGENAKTYTVEFEEGTLSGEGNLKSGACSVEIKEDGDWVITNKDGVLVTIPPEKIKGTGDITTAELTAVLTLESYKFNGNVPAYDLGIVEAYAVVESVDLKMPDDPYDEIKRYFYNSKNKINRDNSAYLNENFGIILNLSSSAGENDIYSADSNSKFMLMIDSLYEKAITRRLMLNNAELQIIENLTELGRGKEWDETINAKLLALLDSYTYNVDNLSTSVETVDDLNSISVEHLSNIVTLILNLASSLTLLLDIQWNTIKDGLNSITADVNANENEPLGIDVTLGVVDEEALEAIDLFNSKLAELIKNSPYNVKVDETGADTATTAILNLIDALNSLENISVNVNATVSSSGEGQAQGNVALAGGRRQTLMGELGPEMYVQNGHYYIAGQTGPEMVSLNDDAIVFNHLQTERLLKNGKTYGHGKPVTNELNAVGKAHAFSSYTEANKKRHEAIAQLADPRKLTAEQVSMYKSIKDAAETYINVYEKANKEYLKALEALKLAAESLEQAAEKLEEVVEKLQKIIISDSNKLHTGYKRATGYRETADESTAGRYTRTLQSKERLPLANSVRSVVKTSSNSNGSSSSSSSNTTKELEEKQKQVASVISNLLSEGFESIDLASSTYEKLDKEYKKEMQAFINNADASYRDFVEKYGEEANLTIKTFNEQYFAAWQKDIENLGLSSDIRAAAKGLTFFAGGSVGGSAEDLTTLFGEYTDVSELVAAGIIDWNEDLEQFIITSIDALEEFDTNLNIEEFQDIIADSRREAMKSLVDLLSKTGSGEISSSDFNTLNASLKANGLDEISKEAMMETANGLLISYAALVDVYKNLVANGLEELAAAVKDLMDSYMKNITDKFASGLSGSLTNVETLSLKDYVTGLGIKDLDLKFETGAEGMKLATTSAIELYNEVKKIDALLGKLLFDKLKESLEESNDHYKTMTELIVHIVDLQEKINQADKYNDAKIKQYELELALAKEIALVRATSEDSSFNFLDQDIPGAMNNPLNYVKNWSNAWNELRDAASDDKAIDFQHFYNILGEINSLAAATGSTLDFMGTTLDGSLEAWDAAVNKSIDALGTDADHNYGVLLSSFSDGLVKNADDYAASADSAIHTMAKVLVEILDALIQMFEVIVAMEEFEGADIDLDGILDFDEIFSDTELEDEAKEFTEQFTNVAKTLKEKFGENAELSLAFESVKVNGYTLKEIIEDATDGIREINMDAKNYTAAVSVLYEMVESGDFDINNIAASLRELLILNHSNFQGTIEYGDFILNMQYDVAIKKDENGKYVTPSGATYDNADAALRAAALEQLKVAGAGGVSNITVAADNIARGTMTIADMEVAVEANEDGIYYTIGDQQYGTIEAAEQAIYENSGSSLSEGEWRISEGLTVRMSINNVQVENLTKDQISNAVGTEWDAIKKEWDEGVDENGENLTFEAKYGVSLEDHTTEADWENFKELAGIESKTVEVIAHVTAQTEGALKFIDALEAGSTTITINTVTGEGEATGSVITNTVATDTAESQLNITDLSNAIQSTTDKVKELSNTPITKDTAAAVLAMNTLDKAIDEVNSDISSLNNAAVSINTNDTLDNIRSIADELHDINSELSDLKNKEVDGVIKFTVESSGGSSEAKGNFAMAAGTKTLMGELGPELYVSGGRYHIAGLNGAEFVNLPNDAIVFNHLQTQRLLSAGNTGRGRAITLEANAVAMAKGGPAAADAKKTLATLKQLRAMWARLAEASIVDLAGAVASNTKDGKLVGPWLANIERWYNLLLKIARLEKEITYLETLRSLLAAARVPDGIKYYESLVDSLENLRELAATLKALADSYDEYFETRRKELNESPLTQFYEYDEAGQVRYKEGGLLALTDLFTVDDTGKAKYTPLQQYQALKNAGLGEYMLRDSNGLMIEADEDNMDQFYRDSVLAAFERMEAELKEMQDLYTNREDAKKNYLEAITKADKLLLEIIDNQIDIENRTLAALEARELKIIDRMTKERLALADSSEKYFEGLEQALSKEREMYSRQQDQDSLAKLQRRLAILQRSGGSAAEIASLLKEITDKQRDAYFDAQEAAIQEAKDASDLQLEKMQEQIDLMTETLEYEKANGLLWGEVAEILSGTSESIIEFITTNMPEWLEKSATALNEELRTLTNVALQWIAYYNGLGNDNVDVASLIQTGTLISADALALADVAKWNEEIQRTSPGQLFKWNTIDTKAAEIQAMSDNVDNSINIDNLSYNINVDEVAEAGDIETVVKKMLSTNDYTAWGKALLLVNMKNSVRLGR